MDWLTEQIKANKIKKISLAQYVNVSRQAVTSWFKTGRISKEHLKTLEAYFGKRSPYTEIDHDHELIKASISGMSSATSMASSSVPLLEWSDSATYENTNRIPVTQLVCPVPHSKQTFAVKIKDDSMRDKFLINDYVFIDPTVTPVNGSHTLVLLADDAEPVLRQLYRENGKTYLRAANPTWTPQIIETSESVKVIGTAISRFSIL